MKPIPHLRRRLRQIRETGGTAAEVEPTRLGLIRDESVDTRTPSADLFAPGYVPGADPDRDEGLLFFDLETMGLARTAPIFMAGYLYWEGSELRLVQEVARDVAEERLLVESALRRMAERPRVVTYNGKSYDLPLLRQRCHYHGLGPLPGGLAVIDLLTGTRRRYRRQFGDFRLSTVEKEILGKQREGQDVPGFEAPIRFLDFVRTGDMAHLEPVLYHNRVDLTTLMALKALLAAGQDPADEEERSAEDLRLLSGSESNLLFGSGDQG